MSITEVINQNSELKGLINSEVEERIAKGDKNFTLDSNSPSYKRILFRNFFNFINVILFFISFVLLVLGLPTDAFSTSILVLINVIVGATQEIRAKKRLDEIALLSIPKVKVIRNSNLVELTPNEVVLDDLIYLETGDQLVVDGKIVYAKSLEIDEALLTGESDHIHKNVDSEVLSGSFAVSGSGIYKVTKVGKDNFLNRLSEKAKGFKLPETPLQKRVKFVVRLLSVVTLITAILVYKDAVDSGIDFKTRVLFLAVIIATVPQGLIFMTTFSYALGIIRLVKKDALIQHANAVESMSNIDILCLDKTGTLTTGEIKLSEVIAIGVDNSKLEKYLGIFSASSTVHTQTSHAIEHKFESEAKEHIVEVAFSSDRKWSGLAFELDEMRGSFVLGAADILKDNILNYEDAKEKIENLSAKGFRVLAFAENADSAVLNERKLPQNLNLIGILAFSDELKPNVNNILKEFEEAGIKIKVISGDNPKTVYNLAVKAGFSEESKFISGEELKGKSFKELRDVVEKYDIFGRIAPEQKEDLIKAMQKNKHYVAMVGDGVNDLLSLKKADIGISMMSGSGATRNISDIVLISNMFDVLPLVFLEGKRISRGLNEIMKILLSRTFLVLFLVIMSYLLSLEFPLLPRQDSVLAVLTVGIPTVFIALWAEPVKNSKNTLTNVFSFVLPVSFAIGVITLMIFALYSRNLVELDRARTMIITIATLAGFSTLFAIKEPFHEVDGEIKYDFRIISLVAVLFISFMALMIIPANLNFLRLDKLEIVDWGIVAMSILTINLAFWSFKFLSRK